MKKAYSILLTCVLCALVLESAFAWEAETPPSSYPFNEREDTNLSNGEAAVGLGVHLGSYSVNDPGYGCNYQRLFVAATANSREIIEYGVQEVDYSWYELDDSHKIREVGCYQDDYLYDLIYIGNGTHNIVPNYKIRFYGGPKSGEYTRNSLRGDIAWVSTNGFVCFYPLTEDLSLVGDWKTYPYNIPDFRGPNAFIAPFWTDLRPDLGGKIKVGQVTFPYPYSNTALCVTWEDVPDAYGRNQTFQVIIGRPYSLQQSYILFQYKQVVADSAVKIGIESQNGKKGVSYHPSSIYDGMALLFKQTSKYAYLNYLTIKIIDNDNFSYIYWCNNNNTNKGYNVKFESKDPDSNVTYFLSLAGDIALLATTAYVGSISVKAGLLLEGALMTCDYFRPLAAYMFPGKPEELVCVGQSIENYATVPAFPAHEEDPTLYTAHVVDAAFGMAVDWVFLNDCDHEVKVVAELEYFVTDEWGLIEDPQCRYVQTEELTIKMRRDAGNTINDPNVRHILSGNYRGLLGTPDGREDYYDFYKIFVPAGKTLDIWLRPPQNSDLDLYLYRPDKTLCASSTMRANGYTESITWPCTVSGFWYIEVRLYNVGAVSVYSLEVRTYVSGGGCPFLCTWNGYQYEIDNNLLPTSSHAGGVDVEDFYIPERSFAPIHQNPFFLLYSFEIREFQNEHSFLDQVKFTAIDHPPDVEVGIGSSGEIFTYKDPYSPVSCIDKYGHNVVDAVNRIDNTYYQGFPGDYLILTFENASINEGAKLVLRTDADPGKESIHIQVLNETGEWETVQKIIPRVYWATDIVNLASYFPASATRIKVRLCFTDCHKLDYVGLDTTSQATFQTRDGLLMSAFHSQQGFVTNALRFNDQNYAELIPGQKINFVFLACPKQNSTMQTSFVLYTEGHYFSMP
ncbi:MAG: PPC domain-containing protein [Candidatus Bathyarchaeia archaeon]